MGNGNRKDLNIILKIIFILVVCPKSYVYVFCNRHYGLYIFFFKVPYRNRIKKRINTKVPRGLCE